MSEKPRIFVSYAHDDTEWLNILDAPLKGLRRHAAVDFYDDRQGLGGTDWDAEIKENLEKADIFLALVTANFIASEYIQETELPIARRRREEGLCVIMPVLVRRCHFKLLNLHNVNFMPKDDGGHLKPLSEWEGPARDAALTGIIEHIEEQVKARQARAASGEATTAGGINRTVCRQRAQAK